MNFLSKNIQASKTNPKNGPYNIGTITNFKGDVKMKRVITVVLALALLLGMCLPINAANAKESGLKPLPQMGEIISGFKTKEIGDMELINSKTVLFEHEKTGAKLLYIQNRDIDRSFTITFRTPAVDDTGVNHILEHITMSGSEKYPLKNVLFTVLNQTYSTFVNAFTASSYTSYPVASMSEDQLLKLTDVYMDCVYNPSVYNDPRIFQREAWRYEMENAGAPLNINGTVYNEMKGSLGSIATAAYYNVLATLYPDSYQSNISGGDPEKIKDLTYDQLIKTHKAYYHPSNSLMILYGNVDYAKFLKLINDNYLSKYDKKEIKVDYIKVAPFGQKVEKTYEFPVSADSNTKNAAQIDYAFALSGITEEDIVGLGVLATILSQDSSPLKKAFNEKKIGGSLNISMNTSLMQPVLTFSAISADEAKAGEFKTLVDESISKILKTGYDKELTDAAVSSAMLSFSNITEQKSLGVNLSSGLSTMWANNGDLNYYNSLIKNIKNISNKTGKGYMEALTEKYIHSNDHAALVTTVPEAGLAEKQAALQQKYLTDLKASMTAQQIEKTVNDTKSYNEWNSKETSQEEQAVTKDLQVVKAADLPVEVKTYDLKEASGSNGERIISAQANVGETGLTLLAIDTSAVPAEKLHYLQLYSSLLGRLRTQKYTKEQLSTQTMRYLNGATFTLSTVPTKDWEKFTPYMITSWIGLTGEYNKQLELVKEIMLNTDFSDSATVSEIVKSQIANMKNMFTSNPVNLLIMRNMAASNDCRNYANYVNGLEYYDFLVDLEQALQKNPGAVLTELDAMHKLVLNKTNMIAGFAGNNNNIKVFEDSIKSLTDALPANKIVPQDYSKLPRPAQKEGISIDTQVQYNMISGTYDKMGTEYNGKYIPIALLINDGYLTPRIRYGNGAYGSITEFNTASFLVISYRDPNIKETFDIYRGIPGFVKNAAITQEELDRYILNAYSTYTATSGELSGAANYISNYLMGMNSEDQLKLLREIKSVTVQDVRDSAAVFESFIKNGSYSTVGSADKVGQNKALYDSVISFGQQTDESLTTAKFFELLLAGVPNPVEFAKQNGLLLGDGKGNYFENELLTKEKLAVIINRVAAMNGKKLSGDNVSIADSAGISSWAAGSVKALVGSGIEKLDSNGKFDPKAPVTSSYVQSLITELMNVLTGGN